MDPRAARGGKLATPVRIWPGLLLFPTLPPPGETRRGPNEDHNPQEDGEGHEGEDLERACEERSERHAREKRDDAEHKGDEDRVAVNPDPHRRPRWDANLLTAAANQGVVRVQCRLELVYDSARNAKVVARSLKVDDETYITTRVRGRTVVAEAKAESFRSLLHTLEDYLACVAVAEKLLRG